MLEIATAIARLENEARRRHVEFERLAITADPSDRLGGRDEHRRRASRLVEIASEIVQLENEIALRRQAFERMLSGGEEQTGFGFGAASGAEFAMRPLARASSLVLRVQATLDMGVRPLTAHDVSAQLLEPVDSVRAALSKLCARGTAERVATGLYRSIQAGHRKAAGEDD